MAAARDDRLEVVHTLLKGRDVSRRGLTRVQYRAIQIIYFMSRVHGVMNIDCLLILLQLCS